MSLDMREPLPFSDDSVSIIYSEHFFGHLDYPNVAKMFLQECFRVLELDGIFRLARLRQPDRFSPCRMAEMLRVDKIGREVRC